MEVSADAVNVMCSLRNRTETVGGRLVYDRLVETIDGHKLTGVTFLHASGYYRGDVLRSIESEIGSNELAVSLQLVGQSSHLHSWLQETEGLLRGKGIITVDTQRDAGTFRSKLSAERERSLYPDFYDGKKVEIYMMESRQIDGIRLYQRAVEVLRDKGAVWVSVTRAIEGFGVARSVRKTGWLWKRNEVPVVVTAVGSTEYLEGAVEELTSLPGFDGYVTAHSVNWYAP